MAGSISLTDTTILPTLGQTFAEMNREKHLTRETVGAGVFVRSLDRMNGMERTGAPSYDQFLFGGIAVGKSMDWHISGNYVPRDAFVQTQDLHRGMQTLHMGTGHVLDTSV